MLVIVRDNEGYFYIAEDTRDILFDIKVDDCLFDNCPIFNAKTNSKVLIGTHGKTSYINFVRHSAVFPSFRKFDFDNLFPKLFPNLLNQLIEKNIIRYKVEAKLPYEIVFAKGKEAYVIYSHCSLYKINSFDVFGPGLLMGESSLTKSSNEKDALKRVFKAFFDASKRSNSVGRNLFVGHTKGAKPTVKLYKEEDILAMYPDLDE